MAKAQEFFKRYPVVGMALLVGLVGLGVYFSGQHLAAQILITVFVGAFCLWTAIDMIRDMIHGHFGLDILALVAMVSTLVVGEYWASIVIVLMLSGGEALEDFAANRAQKELTSLLDRSPSEAHRITAAGETEDIPVDQVATGDLLLVRPAEVVPVDAEVVSPEGIFDQSSLTGESLPVTIAAGDEVPSGSINGAEAVTVRALRISADSQYQQIIRLVQEAQNSKAPVVRLADRFAVPFTIISLLIAGVAWWISGDPVRFAEVLVLATPCPLLIAAPVAFMGGMSRAAKAGVVVKGGAALEQGARIKSVAMDKTGTITEGTPTVLALHPVEVDADELLSLAAAAEQYSTHVLAEGIRSAAADANLSLPEVHSAREIPAAGVEAQSNQGTIRVGQYDFIAEAAPTTAPVTLKAGEVATYVSLDDRFIGTLILGDHIRPEAKAVIAWLKAHEVDEVAMLTGDSGIAAHDVAAEVGITTVYASLKPADKVRLVKEQQPKPTLMVGDGINDAPVLAAANVGVAMGAKGATAAGEAADTVILKDSLTPLAYFIAISKHTLKVALGAVWLGVIASVVLMLIATTGVIPAVIGALIQEVLDLAAILFALRALGGELPEITVASPARQRLAVQ